MWAVPQGAEGMLPSPGGRTAGLLLLVAVADQAVLLRSPGVAAARHAAQPAARGPARPLALRGGAGEDEAGVAHALLEPSFAAAAPARTNPRSGATRVAFGDFPGAPPAKRRRGDGPAGLREITGKKDEYEELFGDLHTPERPGFLESIPELPQYEPDSDELGDDDVRRSRAPVPSRPRCRACACARACRERCAPRPARACEPWGV